MELKNVLLLFDEEKTLTQSYICVAYGIRDLEQKHPYEENYTAFIHFVLHHTNSK
jgi:hypothetical protein